MFELIENTSEYIKLCEKFKITQAGVEKFIINDYTIKRETEFFYKLFAYMSEKELLLCKKLIETNLIERYNYD